jgi:hypothetical protein
VHRTTANTRDCAVPQRRVPHNAPTLRDCQPLARDSDAMLKASVDSMTRSGHGSLTPTTVPKRVRDSRKADDDKQEKRFAHMKAVSKDSFQKLDAAAERRAVYVRCCCGQFVIHNHRFSSRRSPTPSPPCCIALLQMRFVRATGKDPPEAGCVFINSEDARVSDFVQPALILWSQVHFRLLSAQATKAELRGDLKAPLRQQRAEALRAYAKGVEKQNKHVDQQDSEPAATAPTAVDPAAEAACIAMGLALQW